MTISSRIRQLMDHGSTLCDSHILMSGHSNECSLHLRFDRNLFVSHFRLQRRHVLLFSRSLYDVAIYVPDIRTTKYSLITSSTHDVETARSCIGEPLRVTDYFEVESSHNGGSTTSIREIVFCIPERGLLIYCDWLLDRPYETL